VYLPAEDLERFGCTDADLAAPAAPPALRRVVLFESDRARVLLRSGVPLVAGLSGSARLAIAGFVAGGLSTLDAFDAAGHDVLSATRRPSKPRVARHLAGVLAAARRHAA
jgi:phytoene/squalene synthetase